MAPNDRRFVWSQASFQECAIRILFLDDDPDARTLAVRAVLQEFAGAEALEAADRASLLRQLDAGPVDILVTDYDLRWTDGFAVFDLAIARHPNCVAVMFTGTGNEALAVRAMKTGFADYVVKSPGQLRRLANGVRMAYERAAERRLLQDNREILRKELYHRLHNNLQIIISLMALTLRGLVEPRDKKQVRALIRRVQSFSLLQERFYRSEDLRSIDIGAFISGLVQEFDAGEPNIDFVTEIEPMSMSIDEAVPVGLIANELLMEVRATAATAQLVTMSLRATSDGGELHIFAPDAAEDRSPSGLGIDLVQRLASQIGATVIRQVTVAGIETRVSFVA
ncbi:sensor histidine kinase [Sphingomonas sp. IW22]|uniref:sensor histidine kinase n=1 Tax=Sphingomonas sp. IW22 TaxID=3242489 RepID=UPI00352090E1